MNLQVCEIMHDHPVCGFPTDTVTKAAQLMREQDTGMIPVIEPGTGGKLLGVITDRDICVRVIAAGLNPDEAHLGDFMTSDPICCGPRDPVEYAMLLMRENHIRRIPVVDREYRIGGMLTIANLVGNVPNAEELARLMAAVSSGHIYVSEQFTKLIAASE